MINTVLFVGEEYLRETIMFNLNVDIKDLEASALVAQDMHIQPILGTTFYNELQLAYSAQTLDANQTDLMSYIKPAVAYQAAQMTLPFLAYNIRNIGPQIQNSDNSTNVEPSTFHFLRKEIQNRAEFYTQRLIAYLCQNATLFPTYQSSQNSSTDMVPTRQTTGYKNQIGLYGGGCGYGNGFIDGTGALRRFI
jgi:hypothetical protein